MDNEAPIGHNKPPSTAFDEEETPLQRAMRALKLATANHEKGAAKTQEEADAAEGFISQVQGCIKQLTEAHKVEKKPHLDAGKAVDQKYKPVIEQLENAKKALKSVRITPFLVAQENKRLAEERAAREAEEAKRQEAEEAAKKAEENPNDFSAALEADQHKEELKAAEKTTKQAAKAPVGARHGASKKATTLREYKVGKITDMTKFIAANLTDSELVSACEAIANRRARQDDACDGMTVEVERRAV